MSEKIKKLNVTVTYSVGLGNLSNVPKKVVEQLEEAYDSGHTIASFDVGQPYQEAMDWLVENIKQRDCFDWECEIDNLE